MAQILACHKLLPFFRNTNVNRVIWSLVNFSNSSRNHKQEDSKQEEVNNEPRKYFGSHASRWTAQQSRSGSKKEDMPWFQPYVVNFSVAIFLIYFCILREENNIDEDLGRSLFEHIPGLEEKQLILNYHYNKENGLSTVDIENRMKELGMNFQPSN